MSNPEKSLAEAAGYSVDSRYDVLTLHITSDEQLYERMEQGGELARTSLRDSGFPHIESSVLAAEISEQRIVQFTGLLNFDANSLDLSQTAVDDEQLVDELNTYLHAIFSSSYPNTSTIPYRTANRNGDALALEEEGMPPICVRADIHTVALGLRHARIVVESGVDLSSELYRKDTEPILGTLLDTARVWAICHDAIAHLRPHDTSKRWFPETVGNTNVVIGDIAPYGMSDSEAALIPMLAEYERHREVDKLFPRLDTLDIHSLASLENNIRERIDNEELYHHWVQSTMSSLADRLYRAGRSNGYPGLITTRHIINALVQSLPKNENE